MGLKTCKLKITLNRLLNGETDFVSIGEISEMLLEEGYFEEAIEQAKIGLESIPHFNAETVKIYCVLMRGFFLLGKEIDSQYYFDLALQALANHWGDFHPMNITIYCIMALILIEKKYLKEAELLYRSSLICC